MSLVGYVRVSSLDQDTTTQLERVTGANCEKVFSEKQSGTTTKGRTALTDCLEYLREGDSLVITKIDRLARSTRDLHNLVHDLTQRGISLMVLDQNIDTSTTHGKAKGKYTGRKPTAQNQSSEIMALVEQGFTKTAISEQVGISVASVYNVMAKVKKQQVETHCK